MWLLVNFKSSHLDLVDGVVGTRSLQNTNPRRNRLIREAVGIEETANIKNFNDIYFTGNKWVLS